MKKNAEKWLKSYLPDQPDVFFKLLRKTKTVKFPLGGVEYEPGAVAGGLAQAGASTNYEELLSLFKSASRMIFSAL